MTARRRDDPKTSLVIGVAVTALAFGVPTALGEGRLAGSGPQDGGERAMQPTNGKAPSNERTRSRVETPKAVLYKPGPVVKGSRAPHSATAAAAGYIDAGERGVGPTNPIVVSATHSGVDLEWPQLGVGFGLGVLLAVASFLAARMTRVRRLFH